MRGWRVKLIFLLVVYFAGYATAIYTLVPAPQNQANQSADKTLAYSAFKSDEFAKSFNAGMHKCIYFGKDAAVRAAKFIKQKMNERQTQLKPDR
jgi:hypothetical protein